MLNNMTIAAAPSNKSTLNLMGRLVKTYLRPYTGQLLLAVFFMIIAAAMTASIAQLMQPVLDDVLGEKNASMIKPVGVAIFITFFVRGISSYIHTIIMNKVGQSIIADIQKDLFSHFMCLDLSFFHNNPSGQLISRVVNDVSVVRIAVSDSLTGIGKNFMTLMFLVAVMFYQDWKLTLLAFTISPFLACFVAYIGRRLRKISKGIQQELSLLTDKLSQIFQGIRQVQAYGMEAHENERAGTLIDSVKKKIIKSVRVSNMSTPFNETLVGAVVSGMIVYGGYSVAEGTMTAGQLAAFLSAFIMAYEPMKKLARLNNSVQMGLGAAERVFAMIDIEPEIKNSKKVKLLKAKSPEIEFRDVEFSYDKGDDKALNGISFIAESGKVTALVGSSGGGKSTIINLIPRFYDPNVGEIFIDGIKIPDIKIESLRKQIALVSQDITIFDDTIAENIAYGHSGADMEEIIIAAQSAAADSFIKDFPEGYQTRVGEDGVKLSGGQKQRITIARAMLRNAPILLLDEATSALDNESEKFVQDALKVLEKGRTTIVIAHRLSTVRYADQIIVLDKGKIVEQGSHEQLMKKKGQYEKMYKVGLKG